MLESSAIESKLAELQTRVGELAAERDEAARQREQYKQLYMKTLELCRKLELGLVGPKSERFTGNGDQVTLPILQMLVGNTTSGEPPPARDEVRGHTRKRPTGRKPLPETLPRVDIELIPPEVQQVGLDAFERIGEEVTEAVERRPASLVVVRMHKPKFARKDRDKLEACEILQSAPPELPIERGIAGPALIADTIVRRWQDHLPLHRLERIYGREGLPLARSTVCGWHASVAELARPLVDAMWADAFLAPYLCVDATGVLVQENEKCRRAHFWVVAAPEKHVLFNFTPKHDSAAVDRMLKGYTGYLVSDAHSVYQHLYKNGDIVQCGCLAHARRYFWKALDTDPPRAKHALSLLRGLFELERQWASTPPDVRRRLRLEQSKPLLDEFFGWCSAQALQVLDETPISKAIGYALNQRVALARFLDDGRLPIHNNFSERELRREAIGRRNWLFLGSDDAGEVNTTFVTLLASCQLHGIEPSAYLRDLLCLLPSWPAKRVLELAPAYWNQTLQNEDAQQRLLANVFRQVSIGALEQHRATK